MRVGQEQVLLGDVVTESDPDVTGKLGKKPDLFTFPESTRGVVSEATFSNHRVQKREALAVLDRDIGVPNDTQHILGIGPEHSLSARHDDPVLGQKISQCNIVIETGRFEGFLSRSGGFETRPQTVPGDLSDVHNGGTAILN